MKPFSTHALQYACHSLQAIEETNKGDVGKCHTDMLIHWFRQLPPNTKQWSAMVKALRSSTVARGDIADHIEN